MRELKPCPFCGGKPELLETMCIEPDWWSAGVFCSHGHTSIQMLADGRTADEAYERVVAGWNRRAEWLRELTTLKAENEKLRELVRKWYPHMLKRVGRDALEQWGQMDVVKELGIEVIDG